MCRVGSHKLKGLDVIPDEMVRNALFQGAFAADMYAMGLAATQARWQRGLPVPQIMGRDFGRCVRRVLTKEEMECLGLDAGRHLARGFFLEQVARLGDERAQRSLESWVRMSKLHIGS